MRLILPLALLLGCRAAPATKPAEAVASSGLRHVVLDVDKLN
jgi:hypothetical protein